MGTNACGLAGGRSRPSIVLPLRGGGRAIMPINFGYRLSLHRYVRTSPQQNMSGKDQTISALPNGRGPGQLPAIDHRPHELARLVALDYRTHAAQLLVDYRYRELELAAEHFLALADAVRFFH